VIVIVLIGVCGVSGWSCVDRSVWCEWLGCVWLELLIGVCGVSGWSCVNRNVWCEWLECVV